MKSSIRLNRMMELNASLALTVMDEVIGGEMKEVCMLAIIRNQVKDLASNESLMRDEFIHEVAEMMMAQN